MRSADKWNMYVDALQSHPNRCKGSHSIRTMQFIRDMIPVDRYNHVLDIGAGEGLETKVLKDLGYDPVGMVKGKTNMDWAKKNYPDVTIVEGDMHDLPFGVNSFDAIYTNQVFEHAFAPFIFLLECYRVLKPGGLFYVEVPSFEERNCENDPASIYSMHISHHHPSLFSDNIMKQMFEKTGFCLSSLKKEVNNRRFLFKKLADKFLHSDVIITMSKIKEGFSERGMEEN